MRQNQVEKGVKKNQRQQCNSSIHEKVEHKHPGKIAREYGERKDEIVPGERDSAGKGAE